MKSAHNELLVYFTTQTVEMVEVTLDTHNRPIPVRMAVGSITEPQDEQTLTTLLRQLLEGARIKQKQVTLVVNRGDLIIRPEIVPEAVLSKPSGYAVASVVRNLPVPPAQLGEIAGGLVPLGDNVDGKRLTLICGLRTALIERYLSILTRAGLEVDRLVPFSYGTVNTLQLSGLITKETAAVRIDTDGAEIIHISDDSVLSVYITGKQDDSSFIERLSTEINRWFKESPSEGIERNGIYLFGSGVNGKIQKVLSQSFPVKLIKPWYEDLISYYQPQLGLRLHPVAQYCLGLVSTGFAPSVADMRTPRMIAQTKQCQRQYLQKQLLLGLLSLLLIGICFGLVYKVVATNQVEQINTRYDLVKGRAQRLAATSRATRLGENRLSEWGQMIANAPDWVVFLSQLQSILPNGIRIESLKLDSSRDSTLTGITSDSHTVSQLAEDLTKLNGVSKVAIAYVRATEGNNVRFGLTITAFHKEGRR